MMEKTIIILHGWKSSAEMFKVPIKLLSEKGYEVFTPDLPGFGNAPLTSAAFGVDDYVSFVLDYIKKKEIKRFVLVGHSFGGRIAIKFAYRYPEKLTALVLCSAAGVRPRFSLKRSIFYILAKVGRVIFVLPPLCVFIPSARKTLYFLAREKDYLNAGQLKETFNKVISEDLTKFLCQIKVPTLILWGEKDNVTPISFAQKMFREIPQANLEIVKDATHKFPYERPREFVNHVDEYIRHYQK